jgi:catechol 2,3-dioxygenase-like lactoylglutathione lyase family enzyme
LEFHLGLRGSSFDRSRKLPFLNNPVTKDLNEEEPWALRQSITGVLVVKDLEETFAFYRRLGLEAGWQERPGGRGKRPIIRISETQKLNLYVVDRYEIESPTFAPGYATGSADLCLHWEGTVEEARNFLERAGVPVLHEPAARLGAQGPGTSLYVRDPDDNLIELITYGDSKYR